MSAYTWFKMAMPGITKNTLMTQSLKMLLQLPAKKESGFGAAIALYLLGYGDIYTQQINPANQPMV